MTPIGVKSRKIRNLYVLIVYAAGSRKRVFTRSVSRRPWAAVEPGQLLREHGRRVRVSEVRERVERGGDIIEHVVEVFTRGLRARPPAPPPNVVRMPAGDGSMVAQFIRFHVLVRVYGGDPDAWLAHLRERGEDDGDVRFVRWIRTRLRHDPSLLTTIERLVDRTPFWRAAEA